MIYEILVTNSGKIKKIGFRGWQIVGEEMLY